VHLRRREDVYRTYWTFAAERQRVFLQRATGEPDPWTTDTILQRFKFCNAYRASDRVSQFLIGEVIYTQEDFDPEDTLLRVILFRLFSKPSTWIALEAELGPIGRSTLRTGRLAKTLERLQSEGPIYTSAFILCANNAYGQDRKFLNHIELLRDMFRRRALPASVARARKLADVYEALRRYPLIGPFMGYQLAIDINYSDLIDFDENEFTVPGPGAERGITKVFPDAGKRDMASIIHWMTEHQLEETARLGIELPTLFNRHLHAIDCQNLFCELDKYARQKFPELKSNRSRIKSKFAPSTQPLELFYPPKWRINDHLPKLRNPILREFTERPASV
jgi:alpha-glutamyl/putrescinyl thymine pyrophosphorylase clade 1